MGCFESIKEKKFKLALAAEDAATIALGENFLKSVLELKNLIKTDGFFEEFLDLATSVLDYESNAAKMNLQAKLTSFKSSWEENREYNALLTGFNVFGNCLFFPVGIAAGVMGAMALHKTITGIVALSMGPWGMGALAVAFGLLGLAVAAYTAYQIYRNVRLCKDSQLQEISEFIDHIVPPQGGVQFGRTFSTSNPTSV